MDEESKARRKVSRALTCGSRQPSPQPLPSLKKEAGSPPHDSPLGSNGHRCRRGPYPRLGVCSPTCLPATGALARRIAHYDADPPGGVFDT
jgi:hypothetical protein